MIVNPGSGAGKNGAPAKHAAQHGKNGTDHVTPASIGAAAENHSHSKEQVGAAVDEVLAERTINGKPLNEDVTLTASDVQARPDSWMPTAADVGAAAAGHTHTPAEIGAAAANHTHTPASIGAAAASHSHTAAEVGARPDSWMPTAADVGAAAKSHSHSGYASTSHTHTAADVGALPSSGGTLTGDLRIKGSGNFGTKINLGDGDYVHISEPTDDCMEIKAKKINFVTTDTTDAGFTLNGEKIGGGASVEPAATAPKAPGTAAVGTSAKYAREDHVHPSQTSVSGNAGSATKLATARTIDGVSFNGSAAITHYGTCATAAATAAKVVSCTGFTLVTGARIAVKFSYANTAASPTLNVNSTGAKAIALYGTAAAGSGAWSAGEVVEFVYDGTRFVIANGAARDKVNTHTHTGYVPTSRMINGKSLTGNIALTAADLGGQFLTRVFAKRSLNKGDEVTITGIDENKIYFFHFIGYGIEILDPRDVEVGSAAYEILIYGDYGNIHVTRPTATTLKITNENVVTTRIMEVYRMG